MLKECVELLLEPVASQDVLYNQIQELSIAGEFHIRGKCYSVTNFLRLLSKVAGLDAPCGPLAHQLRDIRSVGNGIEIKRSHQDRGRQQQMLYGAM